MENRAHAIIAGIFMFLLAAALIATAVWLSGDTVRYKSYELVAKTPVSGLNPEAQVRLRGVIVGKVRWIRFDPANPLQILVRIDVDEDTPITRSTFATLGYQGITGLAYVNLDDTGKDPAPLPSSDDKIAQIELQPSFFDQVALSGQELLINAGETAKRLNEVLDERNRKRVADTLANLDTLSKRMIAVAEKLEPALAGLPQIERKADAVLTRADALFADLHQLSREARAQLASVERASGALQQGAASWRALGDRLSAETVPSVNGAVGNFSRSTRSVDRLASELREEPQQLLFGQSAPEPGPGEPGFQPPRASGK